MNKKDFLILTISVILIGLLVFVMAATTVISPVAFGNYSNTMLLNCTTTLTASTVSYNVTFYYSATGGATGTSNNLTATIWNETEDDSEFNVTVDISWLGDALKLYNITCYADNGTNQTWASSAANITIDHTAPSVTNFISTVNGGNYTGTIVINVSAVDATIGMDSVYFNITNSTGKQVGGNFTIASTTAGGYYNLSVDTTKFIEGFYNITVYANDTHLNNLNKTERIQVAFDRTAPYEVNFTSTTVSYGNYSGSLVVNISVLDAVAGVGTVFFNITNSTGQQNATYTASCSGIYCNATIPTTGFPDGVYNITVWANDSVVSQNNTAIVYNVTFDNTAPTGSVSCSPSNVVSGDTITCSCGPSDLLSGINTTATVITANPSTANTGTYTSSCIFADRAGNTGSASATYAVSQGAGGGSSSGTGTTSTFTYSKTIPQTAQDFSEIKKIETSTFSSGGLKAKERVKIKLNNEEHHIGVREIKDNKVTVEIASDPVQVELDIGEDAKVDVDEDNFYDIYVKLNGITNSVADLTIEYLHEEIAEGEGAVETTGEDVTSTAGEKITETIGSNLTWLYWVAGIIIILIVAVILFKKKK